MFSSAEGVQRQVQTELAWEPSIDSSGIGVAVQDGVVTLTGHVKSYAQRLTAEKAAKRIHGVHAVANELDVRLTGSLKRDDSYIAQALISALKWNDLVPKDAVTITVRDGWVTLEGEVEWNYQRLAAENTLRYLTGVRGITNSIKIKSRVTPADVRDRIQNAFKRNAQLDANHVNIALDGSSVVLTGTVRSWSERAAAQHAAYAAPGVTFVNNRLKVEEFATAAL